jgi:hypothetical protein
MSDGTVHPADGESAKTVLRSALTRADARVDGIMPVLRHLVAAEPDPALNDEAITRVRSMIGDLSAQLIGNGESDQLSVRLSSELVKDAALLAHIHSLALEWQIAESLNARLGVDPVVSPLLQSLISSADMAVQSAAITFLAAQARWRQTQSRMKLPLRELPVDALHSVLQTLRTLSYEYADLWQRADQMETLLRSEYDEGATRLGAASHLLASILHGGWPVLDVIETGATLFLSAASTLSWQRRENVVLAAHDGQFTRLALALRAAGAEPLKINEQLAALYPDAPLPANLRDLSQADAGAILGGYSLENGQ